ncbi:MAG: cellulase family glycosylhydrolase [Planctomycetes bacterium]|nr:cellulase family glycosylhydrolase [Planctomycetota bacterium]
MGKKRALKLIILLLAFLIVSFTVAFRGCFGSQNHDINTGSSGNYFLTTSGDKFMHGNSAFTMKGFNYFPRNYAWASMAEWDWVEVDEELALASSLGANTVRTFIDYGYSTDNPDESKDIYTNYHPTMAYINSIQRFLNIAAKYNLKVILGFFDYMPGWAFIDNGDHETPKKYLTELIPHFRNSPTIAAWDIMNEGDMLVDKYGTDYDKLLSFYRDMSAHISVLDRNHLITAGFGKIDKAADSKDFVDFISFHRYEDPADLGPKIRTLKASLGKAMPIVDQEYGYASAGNAWASASGNVTRLASHSDIIFNNENLAGGIFWMLMDLNNPPATALCRAGAEDLDLKYGAFSSTLEAKPSVEVINKYFTGQNTSAKRIKFQYSQVETTPVPGDGRYLALAFTYLEFLAADTSVLKRVDFGTIEANKLQGQGWYPNEPWGQWTGNLDKVNTLYVDIPANTASIKVNVFSYQANNAVDIWIGETFLGTINVTPAVADYILAVP